MEKEGKEKVFKYDDVLFTGQSPLEGELKGVGLQNNVESQS